MGRPRCARILRTTTGSVSCAMRRRGPPQCGQVRTGATSPARQSSDVQLLASSSTAATTEPGRRARTGSHGHPSRLLMGSLVLLVAGVAWIPPSRWRLASTLPFAQSLPRGQEAGSRTGPRPSDLRRVRRIPLRSREGCGAHPRASSWPFEWIANPATARVFARSPTAERATFVALPLRSVARPRARTGPASPRASTIPRMQEVKAAGAPPTNSSRRRWRVICLAWVLASFFWNATFDPQGVHADWITPWRCWDEIAPPGNFPPSAVLHPYLERALLWVSVPFVALGLRTLWKG